MSRYTYDFHIHSCLSPCGDDDSTPDSIAGMGELNRLDIMALTDHNTCKNCPAFFKAAKRHGVLPIAGMELTTSEDIHIVCLFEKLEDAMEFDRFVDSRRVKIRNRTDIFGNQIIMNENDEIVGSEDFLLSNATTVPLEEVPKAVERFNGICYPAHVDRESNGILAVLGAFPPTPHFSFIEVHDPKRRAESAQLCGKDEKNVIVSSDAHYLWNISEAQEFFELDADRDRAVEKLFKFFRGVP